MDINLKDYAKDGKFDMKGYLAAMNDEYNKRKRNENGVIECNSLQEILETKVGNHNFIILGTLSKAVQMHHIAIYYSKAEGVFVNVMEGSVTDFVNNKFKELGLNVRV